MDTESFLSGLASRNYLVIPSFLTMSHSQILDFKKYYLVLNHQKSKVKVQTSSLDEGICFVVNAFLFPAFLHSFQVIKFTIPTGKMRHGTTPQISNLLFKNLFGSLCIFKCFQAHMAQNGKAEQNSTITFCEGWSQSIIGNSGAQRSYTEYNLYFISFHSR